MALVLWIAQHIFNLSDLLIYVDDNFSWEFAHCTLFYPPYACFFPEKQARLLLLWDKLGIPHERRKQEFGVILKIIGYQVDVSAMNISMDTESKQNLLDLSRCSSMVHVDDLYEISNESQAGSIGASIFSLSFTLV